MKKIFGSICILMFILGSINVSFASIGSQSYSIPTSVLSGGGTTMASENFRMNSTIGQPSALMQQDDPPCSETYSNYPGFWYTIDIVLSEEVTVPWDFEKGWSLISLPVKLDNASVQELFSEISVIYGYKKGLGYFRVKSGDSLEAGKGYWVLLNNYTNYTFTGQPIRRYSLSANEDGWHMIGGCTNQAKASINNGKIGIIYRYDPFDGYKQVHESENLEPGKGYWILLKDVNQARLIVK